MSDDPERDVRRAERAMDDEIRDMEHHLEQLDEDIQGARDSEDEMFRVTGDDGGDIAGDWRDMDDESGGEDPKGA
jgi:hypothetical protein